MALILLLSLLLSGYKPQPPGVLAYATNVSQAGLLQATNSQRSTAGAGALTLNSKLSQAAQAKANDMTTRDYWSHNTPDGEEPWVFIIDTGYSYLKAGENLAYGFATSNDTVTGWMNSPTHKANMLDVDYSEVGFGYANSSDFNSAGEETVVVAMYGKPQVLAATPATAPATPAAAAPATPAPKEPAPASATPTPASTPAAAPEQSTTANSTPASLQSNEDQTKQSQYIANTEADTVVGKTRQVSRIEALTGGKYRWALISVAFVSGIAITILLLRHGLALRRLLRNSEQFVLHHPLIDSTLIALVILGLTLSRTVGFTL